MGCAWVSTVVAAPPDVIVDISRGTISASRDRSSSSKVGTVASSSGGSGVVWRTSKACHPYHAGTATQPQSEHENRAGTRRRRDTIEPQSECERV